MAKGNDAGAIRASRVIGGDSVYEVERQLHERIHLGARHQSVVHGNAHLSVLDGLRADDGFDVGRGDRARSEERRTLSAELQRDGS